MSWSVEQLVTSVVDMFAFLSLSNVSNMSWLNSEQEYDMDGLMPYRVGIIRSVVREDERL